MKLKFTSVWYSSMEPNTSSGDADINDVFEGIALTEDRLTSEGYEEGYRTGSVSGEIEGFHLGYHRGAELGAELGFYRGVVETWIEIGQKHVNLVTAKGILSLQKVLELIASFPHTNCEDTDILCLLEKIRSNYKRACALLKINCPYPEATKLTF